MRTWPGRRKAKNTNDKNGKNGKKGKQKGPNLMSAEDEQQVRACRHNDNQGGCPPPLGTVLNLLIGYHVYIPYFDWLP